MFTIQFGGEKNGAQYGTYKTVSTMQKRVFCGLGKQSRRMHPKMSLQMTHYFSLEIVFSFMFLLQFPFFLYLISYFKI